MAQLKSPIDAVITWVDGSDENHDKKRAEALVEDKRPSEITSGRFETRFVDSGEIEYCIRSIRKFAPWIRTIHLLTDNQVPRFLTPEIREQLRVVIVDHTELFESYEWALPTFNSRTLETALWRIPNLGPHFIYFNDDFILTREVEPTYFFRDSQPVLRGKWNRMTRYGAIRLQLNRLTSFISQHLLGITRSMHLLYQIRGARLAGFKEEYFRSSHVPHPLRTDILKAFFHENPDLFEKNIRFTFRSTDQFSAIHLANHLEIAGDNAILEAPTDVIDLDGEMDKAFTIQRKLRNIRNGEVQSICLQGFERFKPKHREEIIHTLDELLES